ncbi:MAG: hypothetical protein AAF267_25525 [Deinococcota bacterium]
MRQSDKPEFPVQTSLEAADTGYWTLGFKADGPYVMFENGSEQKITLGEVQNNLTAITAPTVTNNASEGYAVNSVWIDTQANEIYRLLEFDNPTPGDAVWVKTSLSVDELGALALKNVVAGADIQDGVITLPKLAAQPPTTLVGNNTGASATPQALAPADVRTMLEVEQNATANPSYTHTISAESSGSVTASTHGCGTNPKSVEFYEGATAPRARARIDINIATNGDISYSSVVPVTGVLQIVG